MGLVRGVPELKYAPPKYVQIADQLRDLIVRGELQPGALVPPERDIAAQWGVSRPTATKALDLLRREGHLIGRQGSGTFVADRVQVHRQASERYRRAAETGRIYLPGEQATILAAEAAEAPAHVARALALPSAPRAAIRRQRLILRAGEPVEVSTSWFDARLAPAAPALVARERILEGTLAYLEATTGRRGHRVQERRCARLADPSERQLLQLDEPAAVLVTEHLVLDTAGRPMEFAESIVPPEAWSVTEESLVHPAVHSLEATATP